MTQDLVIRVGLVMHGDVMPARKADVVVGPGRGRALR